MIPLLRKGTLVKSMSYWPPYLGAGIRVKNADLDHLTIEVEMKLRFWNRNYVGTQFGGSLYAMCDPFFMLILMEALGPEYIVWDKSARIQFKKPGRGKVSARFQVPREVVDEIRERLKTEKKVEPEFRTEIIDEQGETIAEIDKTIYVRRKDTIRKIS